MATVLVNIFVTLRVLGMDLVNKLKKRFA